MNRSEVARLGGLKHSREHLREIGRRGGLKHSPEHMRELALRQARSTVWRESADQKCFACEDRLARSHGRCARCHMYFKRTGRERAKDAPRTEEAKE